MNLHYLGKTVGRVGQPIVFLGAGALGKHFNDKDKKDKPRTVLNVFDDSAKDEQTKNRGSLQNQTRKSGFLSVTHPSRSPDSSAINTFRWSVASQASLEGSEAGLGAALDCTCDQLASSPRDHQLLNEQMLSECAGNRFQREFEILECLGHGGFGSVHRVRHRLDDSESAIKSIVLDSLDEQVLREVRVMARLRGHPHIVNYHASWLEPLTEELVAVLDRVANDGESVSESLSSHSSSSSSASASRFVLFVQMDLCASKNLSGWLSEDGNRSPEARRERLVRVFEQLSDAVAHLHEQGFVHRDIKPANVFLGRDGDDNNPNLAVKLGDFGLVTRDHTRHGRGCPCHGMPLPGPARAQLDRSDCGVGTATYAAPEQLKSSESDWRADIFSLGMVVVESFCGPFDTTMERLVMLQGVRDGQLPPAFAEREPVLSNMVLRMVAKDPSRRPEAREVQAILTWVATGTSISNNLGSHREHLDRAPGRVQSAPTSTRKFDQLPFKREHGSAGFELPTWTTSTHPFLEMQATLHAEASVTETALLRSQVEEQSQLILHLQEQLLTQRAMSAH